jgi:hypothetical protein
MKHRNTWIPIALILALGSSAGMARPSSRLVSLPADTVLRIRLNNTIGSDRSRPGDRFMATVDDTSLPRGTRVQGVVVGATRATKTTPGKIGVDFRTLELPDGRRYSIAGTPTGLDSKSVRTASNGRLVATPRSKSSTGKYIAYGAAGGLLIGSLLGKNVVGGLLGAGAGYLLGKNKDKKARSRDVVLQDGTQMGVRLDRRVVLSRA